MRNLLLCLVLAIVTLPVSAGSSYITELQNLDIDNIHLGSTSAAVVEMESGDILYLKNGARVRPVASITKLMTAMVVLDSKQPLDDLLTVTLADKDRLKNTYSRMRFGSRLSRREMLLVALMSSENRAASALGRHYPGGRRGFVAAMNAKAEALGMFQTHFVDTTGLSPKNVSTAADLVQMVRAAAGYRLIREFTTRQRHTARIENLGYSLSYVNTNVLVRRGAWNIALSKTGFIDEAGRCLVMLTEIDGEEVAMVMLNSYGKWTPVGDAGRVKRWINTGHGGSIAGAALRYEQRKLGGMEVTTAGG